MLGSRLYTSRPVLPLGSTKAMINIDHVGAGDGVLTLRVTELQKSTLKEAGWATGLVKKLDYYGFSPGGDDGPFKEAGIPTVSIASAGLSPPAVFAAGRPPFATRYKSAPLPLALITKRPSGPVCVCASCRGASIPAAHKATVEPATGAPAPST